MRPCAEPNTSTGTGNCAKSEHDAQRARLADRLAAIAHPYRLQILEELGRADCVCCGEVVSRLPIAQSTVSQHLKILAQAGLVEVNTSGQKSLYRVNAVAVRSLLDDVSQLRACCGETGQLPEPHTQSLKDI